MIVVRRFTSMSARYLVPERNSNYFVVFQKKKKGKERKEKKKKKEYIVNSQPCIHQTIMVRHHPPSISVTNEDDD